MKFNLLARRAPMLAAALSLGVEAPASSRPHGQATHSSIRVRSRRATRTRLTSLLAATVLLSAGTALTWPVHAAAAPPGSVLRTLTPTPSGNGRAVAFDPSTGHLFYTNAGDPHIYVTNSSGSPITTISPVAGGQPVIYGALTWQSTSAGGILWGGRFDGSGAVDQIDPVTGEVASVFRFAFPFFGSCYFQLPGFIDGLAFDARDNTLWLGDDNATTVYHVRTNGSILARYPVPTGRCRTGIAVSGNFLWLGLQSGPDQAPYDLVRVAKDDPSTVLQDFNFGSSEGPEGLALGPGSIGGSCALWSNQFGASTVLTAWALPQGLCQVPKPLTGSCPTVYPQRPGGPPDAQIPGNSGFSGVYRLGDNGGTVAPSRGPTPSPSNPGPFAALGGVYAKILNCAPWAQPSSLGPSGWVMLQQFGNPNYHAQIGWIQQYGKPLQTLIEIQDPLTISQPHGDAHGVYQYERCDVPVSLRPGDLQCFNVPNPPPGTSTYYTIEFRRQPGQDWFYFYMAQPGSKPQLVAQAPAHFTPNQASVAAETHQIYDQMAGTPEAPEVISDAHVYNQDGAGWQNLFGQRLYNGGEVFVTPQTAPWYGLAFTLPGSTNAKSGQTIKVWDAGT